MGRVRVAFTDGGAAIVADALAHYRRHLADAADRGVAPGAVAEKLRAVGRVTSTMTKAQTYYDVVVAEPDTEDGGTP